MKKIVNGRLRIKNDIYHVVLYWYDENKKQRTRSFTTKINIQEKKAKKRAEEMLLWYKVNFAEEKKQIHKESMTITKFLENYFEKYIVLRNIRQITINTYKNHLNIIINFWKRENKILDNITRSDVDNFLVYLKKERKNHLNTINNTFSIFKAICKMGIEEHLLDNCIFREKYYLIPKRKPKVIFTIAEMKKFMEVLKGNPYELEFLILLTYGCRKGELLGLKFSAIDFFEDTFEIKESLVPLRKQTISRKKEFYEVNHFLKTKNSRRKLPLFKKIKFLLLERKIRIMEDKEFYKNSYNSNWEDYICVAQNGKIYQYSFLNFQLKKIIEKHDLPPINVHALRHSFASIMHQSGMNLKDLQMWLGHSSIKVTADTYVHSDSTRNINVINKVEKIMS